MKTFRHTEHALRIYSGADCLSQLDPELARQRISRAVIFTSRTFVDSPLLSQVRACAGERCAGVFARVTVHSPQDSIEDAAEELKRLKADAIIVLGGGSATVSARAASIFHAEGYDLDAMCTRHLEGGRMHSPKLVKRKIPLIIAPTTPNSAYVKAGAGVFDPVAGERKAIYDPQTRARSIFLHPDLLMSAPCPLVVSASLDNLLLALEGLLSRSGDDISDALLIHAMRLMCDGLPKLADMDGPDLRASLAMAGILAGRGTDNAPAGATTALGHAIGANHHIDNGVAKAIILPHMMRFNGAYAVTGITKLATALDIADGPEALERVNDRLTSIFSALNLPSRLSDLGIADGNLPAIAERAMKDWFILGNARPIRNASELHGILAVAL